MNNCISPKKKLVIVPHTEVLTNILIKNMVLVISQVEYDDLPTLNLMGYNDYNDFRLRFFAKGIW